MKQSTLIAVLPLVLAASPALAQAPAPAAPAPAPAAPAGEAVPAAAPPAPAEAAPAAPPPAAPLPAPEPKAEAAPPPDKLAVSKTGFFQPGINLQVWAGATHSSANPDDEWASTLRVRRAEIKAKGEIIPKTISYMVMFDVARLLDFKTSTVTVNDSSTPPAAVGSASVAQPYSAAAYAPGALYGNGNTSILQDVQLTWMNDYADLSIGQFKIPVSLEGSGSASKLYFPERALVSRAYGDKRDLGLKLEKKFSKFGYLLGLYNGQGQNNLDGNDQKDVALRLEAYPIDGLTLAGVVYAGIGDRDDVGTKDRLEGDLKLEKWNLLLQAEYIHAWDKNATTRLEGQGFYVLAGYTFFDKLQPVVRIGSLDPDVDNDEHGDTKIDKLDEYTTYELGLNYYFKSHDAKLQLAGSFYDPEQAVAKTRFDLILAAQVAF